MNQEGEVEMYSCRRCLMSTPARSSLVAGYSWLANLNGVFAVNKPSGPSSAMVVGQLKKAVNGSKLVLGSKLNSLEKDKPHNVKFGGGQEWWKKKKQAGLKVGHGGTLDPLASGVMVIGVGSGTRELTDYLTNCTKVYEAVAMFGVSTTTYDSTGKILEYGPTNHLTIEMIQDAIDTKFSGEILQLPPIYSALKMNGKPLYEYAREGIPLPKQIESRKVKVNFFKIVEKSLQWNHEIAVLPPAGEADIEEKEFIIKQGQELIKQIDSTDLPKLTSTVTKDTNDAEIQQQDLKTYPTLTFRFSVSSGTYIRSLIHDLAKAVGSTAHMTKLVRVQQGPFFLDKNVFDLQDLIATPPVGLPDTEWAPLLETVILNGPKISIKEAKKRVEQAQTPLDL